VGEATGWFEYKMEEHTALRLTYGSMWTQQSKSGATVTTDDGDLTLPELDERVGYGSSACRTSSGKGFLHSGLFADRPATGIRRTRCPRRRSPTPTWTNGLRLARRSGRRVSVWKNLAL